MSSEAWIAIVAGVIMLVDFIAFIRLTWLHRGDESWPKRASMLGLGMAFVFLYCLLSVIFVAFWALAS